MLKFKKGYTLSTPLIVRMAVQKQVVIWALFASWQLGHNGATPESCWLVDELSVAVPTKGIKYIFQCKCWLAKDRGDGLTARVFNVLDATAISIIRKASMHIPFTCLRLPELGKILLAQLPCLNMVSANGMIKLLTCKRSFKSFQVTGYLFSLWNECLNRL